MTTKITWTHVDAHVRQQCELVGMLPIGANDAEVAYNYLKYVESKADLLQQEGQKIEAERDRLKAQLRALEAKPAKVGKTKQRLAALEKAVAELRMRGENVPKAMSPELAEAVKALQDSPSVEEIKHRQALDVCFGPRDADGWYTWNGDDTMRPAGRVDFIMRDGEQEQAHAADLEWNHGPDSGDIVKWRPAQCKTKGVESRQCAHSSGHSDCWWSAEEGSKYCEEHRR